MLETFICYEVASVNQLNFSCILGNSIDKSNADLKCKINIASILLQFA